MTTSFWLRSPTQKSLELSADIVIVGGGYVGLSTAYWLTELAPNLKVLVLERLHLGSGASGRNAGFLTKGSAYFYQALHKKWGKEKALQICKFAEESLSLVHHHFLKNSRIDFTETSAMTLFQTEKLYQDFLANNLDLQAFGFHWKGSQDLSLPLRKKFYGALETLPEYKVAPVGLLAAIRERLQNRKVQIIENVSAFKLTPTGLMTDAQTVRAKKVVLALNGYFPQFHSSFKSLITPRRAQMLAVELKENFESPSLYYDPPERVYWRKVNEKTLIIGGKRLLDEKGEEGDFEKLSPLIQEGLEDYLSEQLELKFDVLHRWSGTMGFTEHELPFLTKIEAPVETYMAGGFSGHGMGLGFRSGLETAELVTGKKSQSFFQSFKELSINL